MGTEIIYSCKKEETWKFFKITCLIGQFAFMTTFLCLLLSFENMYTMDTVLKKNMQPLVQ